MKLIDKDALVAEIGTLISNGKFKCQQSQENGDYESYVAWSEHIAACGKILSFVNTLEVKEIDLDKEIESYFKGFGKFASVGIDDCIDIAKHFFELGLKAQKGE